MWWTHPRNLEEKKGREGFDILRWKRKVPIVPTRRWCGDVFGSRYVPISSVCLVPFRHFLPDFLRFLTARYFKDAMLSGRKRLEVRGQCAAAEERCVAYQLIPGAVQESWREGKNKKCSRTNIEGGWRRTRCRCFQWGCLTSFSTSAPSGLPCLWHVRMKKWLRAAKEKKNAGLSEEGLAFFARNQSLSLPSPPHLLLFESRWPRSVNKCYRPACQVCTCFLYGDCEVSHLSGKIQNHRKRRKKTLCLLAKG